MRGGNKRNVAPARGGGGEGRGGRGRQADREVSGEGLRMIREQQGVKGGQANPTGRSAPPDEGVHHGARRFRRETPPMSSPPFINSLGRGLRLEATNRR